MRSQGSAVSVGRGLGVEDFVIRFAYGSDDSLDFVWGVVSPVRNADRGLGPLLG